MYGFFKFLDGELLSENVCTKKLQIQNILAWKFPHLGYMAIDECAILNTINVPTAQ